MLAVLETYQKSRVIFVQTIAELATKAQVETFFFHVFYISWDCLFCREEMNEIEFLKLLIKLLEVLYASRELQNLLSCLYSNLE